MCGGGVLQCKLTGREEGGGRGREGGRVGGTVVCQLTPPLQIHTCVSSTTRPDLLSLVQKNLLLTLEAVHVCSVTCITAYQAGLINWSHNRTECRNMLPGMSVNISEPARKGRLGNSM